MRVVVVCGGRVGTRLVPLRKCGAETLTASSYSGVNVVGGLGLTAGLGGAQTGAGDATQGDSLRLPTPYVPPITYEVVVSVLAVPATKSPDDRTRAVAGARNVQPDDLACPVLQSEEAVRKVGDVCDHVSMEPHGRAARMTLADDIPLTATQHQFELQRDWGRISTADSARDIARRTRGEPALSTMRGGSHEPH